MAACMASMATAFSEQTSQKSQTAGTTLSLRFAQVAEPAAKVTWMSDHKTLVIADVHGRALNGSVPNPADGSCRGYTGFTDALQTDFDVLLGPANTVTAVAGSPVSWADPLLAIGCDGPGDVWMLDALTGDIMCKLEGHAVRVTALVFSPFAPNGRTLALLASASSDATLLLWDMMTGECRRTLAGHTLGVNAMAWAPNGTILASASDDATVRLWDVATGVMFYVFGEHTGPVNAVAWAPAGNMVLVTAGTDGTIRFWDVATRALLRICDGHTGSVNTVAFVTPTGALLASGSTDGTVQLWDVASGALVHIFDGGGSEVTSVACAADESGRIASASRGRPLRVWDASPFIAALGVPPIGVVGPIAVAPPLQAAQHTQPVIPKQISWRVAMSKALQGPSLYSLPAKYRTTMAVLADRSTMMPAIHSVNCGCSVRVECKHFFIFFLLFAFYFWFLKFRFTFLLAAY